MIINKIIKITHIMVFCFTLQAVGETVNASSNSQQQIVDLTSNSHLTKLSDILTLLDIKHEFNINSIAECFNQFRRNKYQERWDLQRRNISYETRTKILDIMQQLNLFTEITPVYKQFQQAVIFGATAPTVKSRFEQLNNQWQNNNVRFDYIYFLGSQRPLNINRDYNVDILNSILQYLLNYKLIENNDVFKIEELLKNKDLYYAEKLELAKNIAAKHSDLALFTKYLSQENVIESEAIEVISKIVNLTDEMRSIPKVLVITPNIIHSDNTITRANTRSSLEYWIKNYNIEADSVVVVSSQPYALYQSEVIKKVLNPYFKIINITAPKASSYDTEKLEIYLDNIALFLDNYLNQ